jgi:hypothetical protein
MLVGVVNEIVGNIVVVPTLGGSQVLKVNNVNSGAGTLGAKLNELIVSKYPSVTNVYTVNFEGGITNFKYDLSEFFSKNDTENEIWVDINLYFNELVSYIGSNGVKLDENGRVTPIYLNKFNGVGNIKGLILEGSRERDGVINVSKISIIDDTNEIVGSYSV